MALALFDFDQGDLERTGPLKNDSTPTVQKPNSYLELYVPNCSIRLLR